MPIWSSRYLLNKEYTGEDLEDLIDWDVESAMEEARIDGSIPKDDRGDFTGKFIVTIKWEDDDGTPTE